MLREAAVLALIQLLVSEELATPYDTVLRKYGTPIRLRNLRHGGSGETILACTATVSVGKKTYDILILRHSAVSSLFAP